MAVSAMAETLNYANKVILAPMVRVSTLPMRLLALDYGADIVYSPEIIDYKFLQCERVVNKVVGTIDYVLADGTSLFRTCYRERGKVVFQMGTNDAERALKVAKMVESDVAGIDVNMGCPKEFSVKGGMGAALLRKPEKVKEILTTLVMGLSKPVTCKIRILPSIEETVNLAKIIESTGVKALAIHGRMKEERSSQPCRDEYIRAVATSLSIPVIANGGSLVIKDYSNVEKFKAETGSSSVMLARAAQWNVSVFRKDGPLPAREVIQGFLKYCVDLDNNFPNTKYILCHLMTSYGDLDLLNKVHATDTVKELCELFDLSEYIETAVRKRKNREEDLERQKENDPESRKKRKLEEGTIMLDVQYNKRNYGKVKTPKGTALEYALKKKWKINFDTIQNKERLFKSLLTVEDKRYTPVKWDKSKRGAEHSAAIVFLDFHNVYDGRKEL